MRLPCGKDVLAFCFEKFCVKEKAARKGRNLKTTEDMIIPPKIVVTFKYAGKLRDMLNKNVN